MQGALLINLGTPQSPEPRDVGAYLKEFLMDPFVIDIPFPLRWVLVNVLIVPRRKNASSLLYKKVWSEKGSPLLQFTNDVGNRVRVHLGGGWATEIAMRYGKPAIRTALEKLKSSGVKKLIVFPLYPQYSQAASESSITKVKTELRAMSWNVAVHFMPPFYSNSEYLKAVAEVSAPLLRQTPFDKALFSFHGLPEHQVKKTDPTGRHCLREANCCDAIQEVNRNCYRAQCYATAASIARKLEIPKDRYEVSFQSRLAGTPWIQPFTDEFYRTLPAQGVKKIVVLCPSFVADCLETLEEVSLRGREEFLQHGGEQLTLIPSLNATDVWVQTVSQMIRSAAKPAD